MMTADPRHGACPDPRQLAAYVEGRVTAGERAAIQAHLADCDECREVVADAVRLGDEPSSGKVLPFWRRPRARAIGGGVLALAASLILVVQLRPELNPFRRPTPYEELVAAVGTNRVVEGRLTGGFEYGPLRTARRSGGSAALSSYEVLAAAARISSEAGREASAGNLHALGVARLLTGDVDSGIQALQDAADLQPNRAAFQNDLAAALLARGSADRPRDFALALAAAERALRADSALSEAYFNRALALEKMGLHEAALKAWQDYLSRDGTSGWSSEAKRRAGASGSREGEAHVPATPTPRAVRARVETDLLVQLATPSATVAFANAHDEALRLVRLLEQTTGDRDLSDAVHALSRATRAQREGVRRYAEGRVAYDGDNLTLAVAAFREARELLAASPSPLRLWAAFYEAVGIYYSADYLRSREVLLELLPEATRRNYFTLTGRIEWMVGLNALNLARFEETLTRYQNAAAIFARIGDREEEGSVRRGLWEVHRRLGLYSEAWRHAYRGLAALPAGAEPRRRHSLFMTLGQGSLDQSLPEVARTLFDSGVAAADAWGQPIARVESRLNRARASIALGDRDRARSDVAAARQGLAALAPSALVRRLETELLQAEASVADPAAGIAILTDALAEYSSGGRALRRTTLHLQRARFHQARGDFNSARADLDAAIAELERQLALLPGATLRDTRLAEEWPIYETAVGLLVDRGRPREALEYLERGRAIDWSGAASGAAFDDMLRASATAPVVCFMVRDDRVYIWRLSGTLHFSEVRVPRGMLDRAVVRFTSALRDGRFDDATGRLLYARLLQPIVGALPRDSVVTLVPDGSLHALPFAALPDEGGRLAIERFAFNYAPTVAAAAARTVTRGAPALAEERILVVSDPATDLRPLPRAAAEGREIASLFSRATLIAGPQATVRRIRSELRTHAVVHFAGHAVSGTQEARQSYLVVAAEDSGASARLDASELRQLPLTHVRLGVLSACSTAWGDDLRGLGRASLARALLQSGVSSVVATLWDVEDDAVSRVWPAFYAAVLRGRQIPLAVRDAQLAMLRTSEHRFAWAAIIGFEAVSPAASRSRAPAHKERSHAES
jgi:CHAT domain-containing protein